MRGIVLASLVACGLGAPRLSRPAFGTPLPGGRTAEVRFAPPPALPVRGPRFAPVTIDVYLALPPSPSSVEMAPLIGKQLAAGDVRVVYHLCGNGSPTSMSELEALVEAARQDRFFELVDALIAHGAQPLASAEEIARIGREAGVELAEALATHRHRAEATALTAESRANGRIDFYVNGTRLGPRFTERDLGMRIAVERKRAHALLDEGVGLTQVYDRLVREREATIYSSGGMIRSAEGRTRTALDLSRAPARGPEVAPVTIVLFSSFACPACADLARVMRRVDERFPRQLRFVWKNLPTTSSGRLAAEFASAAHAQGGFWAFHELAQKARFQLDRSELLGYALGARLDAARIDREVVSGTYRAEVQHEIDEAHRLGITSPASAMINGQVVFGKAPDEVYERLIQKELDNSLLKRLTGK